MSYEGEHFADFVRFFDDCERPGGPCAVLGRRIGPAGDENDRNPVSSPLYPFEKIEPAHSCHVNIEDQTVAATRTSGIEKFPARAEFAGLEAFTFEQKPQRIPHCLVIIDYENHRPSPARDRLHSRQAVPPRLDLDQQTR
jgi:hypothetical protein